MRNDGRESKEKREAEVREVRGNEGSGNRVEARANKEKGSRRSTGK